MFAPRHYFFIYRQIRTWALDIRCPVGGLTVRSWSEEDAEVQAFKLAYELYPTRPWEELVPVLCRRRIDQQHAMLMEADKRRADKRFRELIEA